MSDLSGVDPLDIRTAAFGFTIPIGDDVDAALSKLIDKAELRVLSRVPDIAARITAGTTTAGTLAGVIEDMVLRVARNPDGKKAESIDDYRWTLDDRVSAGMLYLSDDELGLLVPAKVGRSFGSIRLSVPSWRLPR